MLLLIELKIAIMNKFTVITLKKRINVIELYCNVIFDIKHRYSGIDMQIYYQYSMANFRKSIL